MGWLARRNAWKWPDEEAMVMMGQAGRAETLTHEAFDIRTDQVANGLVEMGLSKGDTMAVYAQNGVETIELYVGAMKAGVLPVPVNHRFKGDEVAYVLEDSDVDQVAFDVLAQHTLAQLHEDGELPTESFLYVGDDAPEFAQSYESFRHSASTAQFDIVPDRLDDAIVLYTSGTTGRPKGCYLTHDNLLSQVETLAFSQKTWENRADRRCSSCRCSTSARSRGTAWTPTRRTRRSSSSTSSPSGPSKSSTRSRSPRRRSCRRWPA